VCSSDLNIALKRIGISLKRGTRYSLKYDRQKIKRALFTDWVKYILWFAVVVLSVFIMIIFGLVFVPVMIILGMGRILDSINKVLNFIYQWAFNPWEVIYFVATNVTLKITNKIIKWKPVKWMFKNTIIQDFASDKQLRKTINQKGLLPFIAFIGLFFIVAGFILQIFNR
jgi:hypothetical protein